MRPPVKLFGLLIETELAVVFSSLPVPVRTDEMVPD